MGTFTSERPSGPLARHVSAVDTDGCSRGRVRPWGDDAERPIELHRRRPGPGAHGWRSDGMDAAAISGRGAGERGTSGLAVHQDQPQRLGRRGLMVGTARHPCEQSCPPTSTMGRKQQSTERLSGGCTSEVTVGGRREHRSSREQRCAHRDTSAIGREDQSTHCRRSIIRSRHNTGTSRRGAYRAGSGMTRVGRRGHEPWCLLNNCGQVLAAKAGDPFPAREERGSGRQGREPAGRGRQQRGIRVGIRWRC